MHNFMLILLTCSAVMSLIALVYMAVNPLLARQYSEKGRYYAWLIILLGLIIPFRPQWSGALIRVDLPAGTTQSVLQAGSLPAGNALPAMQIPHLSETVPYVSAAAGTSSDWWQIAFAVWLTGLIVFLAFHLVKHISFVKRVKRWSKRVSDEKSNALLESLKSEMGISRQISLAVCDGIGSPMMLGFVRPRILLPETDLAQDELRFILKHELVHYKRGDLFYKCAVLAATAIHWFNPAVYLMAKAINIQCELSCDAEIVQSADDDTRQQYSETIIGVARYHSKFKTILSTTLYGGRKGMKNRISSIMTTNKKKVTFGSKVLAFVLVSVLAFGTLAAFAAERPEPEPGRIMQNIARRVSSTVVLSPEWEEKLQSGEVRFYELDQVTPFDFSISVWERFEGMAGMEAMEVFRIDREGMLQGPFGDADALSDVLNERLSVLTELFGDEFSLSFGGASSMTLEELSELLGSEVEFLPRTVRHGDSSYELMQEQGMSPIVDTDGGILMWVPSSFFEMTYEEFNELAEQLLTTAVIIQTQETVEILREHWLAAQ